MMKIFLHIWKIIFKKYRYFHISEQSLKNSLFDIHVFCLFKILIFDNHSLIYWNGFDILCRNDGEKNPFFPSSFPVAMVSIDIIITRARDLAHVSSIVKHHRTRQFREKKSVC